MIHLLIARAELELVPRELWKHPTIVSHARKRGKPPGRMLLDSNLHHKAMRNRIPEWENRGRPDITHISLLVALGSILSREGELRVYVHTRNDVTLFFSPEIRLPRSYNRFVGLMEKTLCGEGEKGLIAVEKLSLPSVVSRISPGATFFLSRLGRNTTPRELQGLLGRCETSGKSPLFVVGGFPRGGWRPEEKSLADDIISISPHPLEAWVVVAELLAHLRWRCCEEKRS
ncbi:MAG: 16S rRNA methyltransferase [Methanobacteriota archaeon]|nr:MAG: 16S rRNA methyltransferase [Euryarchaeota archaeon]